MSDQHDEYGHGHSPAAWTAVLVMLIGIAAGAVFFFLHQPMYVWISAGIVLIGALLGPILAKAGYGVGGHKVAKKSHS